MSWNLVALDQVPPMPWRNGGGVTRELLAWPSASAWKVRLSIADIEADGPFSRFEGVERGFAVLEGAGVGLRLRGSEVRLGPGTEPLRFDGGEAVDCRLLDGPTRDFNLMAPPGAGRLRRVQSAARCVAGHATLVAAYSHREETLLTSRQQAQALPPRHLAWRLLAAGEAVDIACADALWVEVRT